MEFLRWLEASGPAVALRQSTWAYPIVESLHIVGIVVLVGAAFMWDLRLLGWGRHLRIAHAQRQFLPWAFAGLALIVLPTGLLLFSTKATQFAFNTAFQAKLVLIAASGLNSALFHNVTQRWFPSPDGVIASAPMKLHGVASMLLWTAVIFAGRLIAYF